MTPKIAASLAVDAGDDATAAVAAEALARSSADTTLSGSVSAEAGTRAAADTALSGSVSTEAGTRAAADTALAARCTALEAGTSAPATLYQLAEIQIGTWLGVPLYRKVVALSGGPNQEGLQIPHGITGASGGHVVRFFGYLRRASDKLNLPLPYSHVDNTFTILMSIDLDDGDNIFLTTTAGNYSAFAGHAIVEYTKS